MFGTLQVATEAQQNEITQFVGFCVPLDAEGAEELDVVNVEFATVCLCGDSTVLTDTIARDHSAPGTAPSRTVVGQVPTAPRRTTGAAVFPSERGPGALARAELAPSSVTLLRFEGAFADSAVDGDARDGLGGASATEAWMRRASHVGALPPAEAALRTESLTRIAALCSERFAAYLAEDIDTDPIAEMHRAPPGTAHHYPRACVPEVNAADRADGFNTSPVDSSPHWAIIAQGWC